MTLCLTGVISRTVRAWILSAYYMPFAGGCKWSCPLFSHRLNNMEQYLISVLRVAGRPFPVLFTFDLLNFLSILQCVRKQCD